MVAEDAGVRSRVLVTRPLGDAADNFCSAVEAAGFEARSLPLMELSPVAQLSIAQRQMVFDLDHYQHVVFISSNAVRYGMAQIEDSWPQLPVGLHWYAIGDATAASLAGYGIAAITPGQAMHSEGLLAVPSLQHIDGQRVLIVKGCGGRDTLRRELTRRGALVDELACYRRSVPGLPPGALYAKLLDWRIDSILLSSGEGLTNLLLLLSQPETSKLKHMGLIVPSARVAGMARDAGFDQVVTAENASDEAMLRALCAWQSGTGE